MRDRPFIPAALQRQPQLQVTGVELQPQAAELCRRAAAENQLEDRLCTITGDLRKIRSPAPCRVVRPGGVQPALLSARQRKVSAAAPLRDARSEHGCTLEEVCAAAAYLLRWGGSFCLVHKPERMADVLCALRASSPEAKRLQDGIPAGRPGALVGAGRGPAGQGGRACRWSRP